MFIHTHHSTAFNTDQEHRLCREFAFRGPEDAAETLKAPDLMSRNEDIKKAREIFDNPQTRKEYEQINGQHVLDRTYFQALLLDNALPADKGYTDIERRDINVTDPFNLTDLPDNSARGNWLIANLSEEFVKSIDPSLSDPKSDPARLGQIYMDHIARAKEQWLRDGTVTDTLISRMPLERYAKMRTDLDAVFLTYGVRVPHTEGNNDVLGDRNLNRREYFVILAKYWKGELTKKELGVMLNKDAVGSLPNAAEKMRQLVGESSEDVRSAQSKYIDISLSELGPEETLVSMGITMTPQAKSAYLNLIQGKPANFGDRVASVDGEPEPPDDISITPEQGAGTWERYPERAVPFLTRYMATNNKQNQNFLTSMRFYFGGDKNKLERAPLREDDTRAILRFVSQQLLEAEQVTYQSKTELTGFREKEFTPEMIERTAGELWEYMKDIRSHPIGSGALWIAAIFAARKLWAFTFTDKHSNKMKLLYGALIFGTGITLFQQHQTGKSTLGEVVNGVKGFMKKEKTKDPADQTLSGYWSEQLGYTDLQEKVTLSFMSEQRIDQTLDWYSKMREWKLRGSIPAEQPQAEFRVDGKLQRYFGQMGRRERDNAIYNVLEKFLSNRGAAVRSEIPAYAQAMDIKQDDMLGLAYLRHRYMEQIFFESHVYGVIRIAKIEDEIPVDKIRNFDPEDSVWKEFAKKHEKIYAQLIRVREEYRKEIRQRDTADWNMSTVFMQESNPEILRRMGRDGTKVAGFLDMIKNAVSGTVDAVSTPFTAPPEDLAGKEKLFAGPEATMFGKLSDTWLTQLDRADPPVAMESLREDIRVDWDTFVGRIPVDSQAAVRLKEFMARYLELHGGDKLSTLLNDVEFKKYQLLVAAAQSDQRLNSNVLNRLDPENDGSWNSTLDSLVDWVYFDDDAFPKMNKLSDLRTLFDSEANEQGGVRWYEAWARVFPHWKETGFEALITRVKIYESAFARLRINPVIENGIVLTDEEIDALEAQLSRRMANQTMEAMLRRHGDKNYTPDIADDRTVSPHEQGNLIEYYDQLFVSLVGKPPEVVQPNVKVPGVLEELQITLGEGINASEWEISKFVEYMKPILIEYKDSTLKIINENGKIAVEWLDARGNEIAKFTAETIDGVQILIEQQLLIMEGIPKTVAIDFVQKRREIRNIDGRLYVQPIDRGMNVEIGLAPLNNISNATYYYMPAKNYILQEPITKSLGEYLNVANSSRNLVDEWIDQALPTKSTAVSAIVTSKGLNISKIDISADRNTVEYSDDDSKPERTARTSVFDFLYATPETIADKYGRWIDTVVVNKASTVTDPLKL